MLGVSDEPRSRSKMVFTEIQRNWKWSSAEAVAERACTNETGLVVVEHVAKNRLNCDAGRLAGEELVSWLMKTCNTGRRGLDEQSNTAEKRASLL